MNAQKKNAEINLKFSILGKALTRFEEALKFPHDEGRGYIDATIQRFEFTIELFWKLLKRLLYAKGVEAQFPKDVLRSAYQGKLINNEKMWLAMLNDRNQTSHTYDEELADEIYKHCHDYAKHFRKTYDDLFSRKDEFTQ